MVEGGVRNAVAAAAIACVAAVGAGAASCEKPQDAMAIRTAALQQEMVVAAFLCNDVAAYNNFVLSHQIALQQSDAVLMAFFQSANARTGFDDYNLYKTELANAASLRSATDRRFCGRVNANFRAALGRPLDQLLTALPYPADTGSLRCPQIAVAAAPPPVVRPKRHRTWLGRIVDAVAH